MKDAGDDDRRPEKDDLLPWETPTLRTVTGEEKERIKRLIADGTLKTKGGKKA